MPQRRDEDNPITDSEDEDRDELLERDIEKLNELHEGIDSDKDEEVLQPENISSPSRFEERLRRRSPTVTKENLQKKRRQYRLSPSEKINIKQKTLYPTPPQSPHKRRPSPRRGRSNREVIYQGENINLKNYEILVQKLILESDKLDAPLELLDKLNITNNAGIPEIYQNILDNDIVDYNEADKMLLENIKIFIENKKELDEI